MIAITGATGNTGRAAASALLAAGMQIRVIGRDPERLKHFAAAGADPFVGDVLDSDAMARAFANCRAVYAMIPPNVAAPNYREYQDAAGESLATALGRAGVRHAVALSSIGAQLPEGAGPVSGLHHFEQRLRLVPGLNALFLRPASFFENLLASLGMLRSLGIFAGLLNGDLRLAMIATRDVGTRAAEALRALNFSGHQTQELHGPCDITMNDAAKIIGAVIGKPSLRYHKVPLMIAKPALRRTGMSADAVEQIVELSAAANDHRMVPLESRNAKNTTPTTLEQFAAEVIAPAYLTKAVSA
jgi:uncharacterized protein YbjT (DUF2867 family)